jgi:hypothetical protein
VKEIIVLGIDVGHLTVKGGRERFCPVISCCLISVRFYCSRHYRKNKELIVVLSLIAKGAVGTVALRIPWVM